MNSTPPTPITFSKFKDHFFSRILLIVYFGFKNSLFSLLFTSKQLFCFYHKIEVWLNRPNSNFIEKISYFFLFNFSHHPYLFCLENGFPNNINFSLITYIYLFLLKLNHLNQNFIEIKKKK